MNRLLRFGVAFCGVGILIGFLAVAGPTLGLGADEQSIFYRSLGLTRSALAALGVATISVGAYLAAGGQFDRPLIFFRDSAGILALVLCFVLVLEGTTRAIDHKPLFEFRNWAAERNALLKVQTLNDYDPVIGWVLKPNQHEAPNDPLLSFTTGRYGARLSNPKALPDPPPGAILTVGDSFALGSQVGDAQSWPAQLEQMLGRPVINASAGGWGGDQIVLRIEQLLPIVKPSMVVMSWYEDAINRTGLRVYSAANKPFFTLDADGHLVANGQPVIPYEGRPSEVPWKLIIPSYLYFVRFVGDHLHGTDWQPSNAVNVPAGNDTVAVSCALLRRLKAELGETPLLLLLQYSGYRTLAKPPRSEGVAACARAQGVDMLDLWDDLAAAHDRSFEDYVKLWAGFDGTVFGHMSAAGNRLVAERIAAHLK